MDDFKWISSTTSDELLSQLSAAVTIHNNKLSRIATICLCGVWGVIYSTRQPYPLSPPHHNHCAVLLSGNIILGGGIPIAQLAGKNTTPEGLVRYMYHCSLSLECNGCTNSYTCCESNHRRRKGPTCTRCRSRSRSRPPMPGQWEAWNYDEPSECAHSVYMESFATKPRGH